MKVTLSKYAGFCDGVERAYNIVKDAAQNHQIKKPIFVLGSLVHNKDVVDSIEKLGVKKIEFSGKIEEISKEIDDKIGTLIVTAHGIGPRIFDIAKEKGIDIIDTTCPKVIKVQRLAQVFFNRNHQVVIIGEKKHKEVQGIHRWARKNSIIVSSNEDIDNLKFDSSRSVTVISQTTQNRDWAENMAKRIKKKYPQVEIIDTVCSTTRDRQNEIRELAKNNELILVIGSPASSNSNRLWEIAKSVNENTYFIERLEDIKKEWLNRVVNIGVTAGASSPRWVIRKVVDYLNKV
jgi:4-hydroxy-3-methylbut-2-enyl diphosphate reductase